MHCHTPHLSVTADQRNDNETTSYNNSIIGSLAASDMRLDQIRSDQKEDETCRLLMPYFTGWLA